VSSEENKAVVRRFFEQAWSTGDLAVVDETVATPTTGTPPDRMPGPEGVKQNIGRYRAGLPDITMIVEDQIAEGDKVVTRFTARGTHTGTLMGVAPTGKPVDVRGMSLYRLANGKIVEGWDLWDKLEFERQIGGEPTVSSQ